MITPLFMRLGERLIQQQDAAVSSPAPIRANILSRGGCSRLNAPWPVTGLRI